MKTNYEIRYAAHPEDAKSYDTARIRRDFLIEKIFVPNEVNIIAVGTHCGERYFLWTVVLYSDVSFERAFSFPVLFYKCDPAGGTLHHRCYDYFVSSDPED